jgi:hypothetical protein
MDCQDFLARYSEYLDEVIDLEDMEQLEQHLGACDACTRYDRVMRRGLDLARTIPTITPSSDFQLRLEHRLLHVRDEMSADGRALNGGAAVSLAVAGLLALAAWGPLLRANADSVADASPGGATEVAVYDAQPRQSVAPADAWWPANTLVPAFNSPARSMTGAFPGPYSPLIVSSPLDYGSGAARVINASYPGLD